MATSMAVVLSRTGTGVEAPLVTVEVHISSGLPTLTIVGLPETAVKESRDRVRSSIINSNFEFPSRRITINLAPANLPKKDGGRFDLPIAIGILLASGQLSSNIVEEYEFAGELSLDGKIRRFSGALPFAIATKNSGRKLIVPIDNANESVLPNGSFVIAVDNLLDACAYLSGCKEIKKYEASDEKFINENQENENTSISISDVVGQLHAKRSLLIAAAGRHNMLMVGPPGAGKTMLANRLPIILPQMTGDEALEVAAINSIYGMNLSECNWKKRPFRAPHHTSSAVALVGGGNPPKPGEISLAHNGILFLDELPEFNRHVLDALREPVESGFITVSRAAHQAKFPAKFQLITAMNICPCGRYGLKDGLCNCTKEQMRRYRNKISGPLIDRIDMHVNVLPIKISDFSKESCKKNYVVSGDADKSISKYKLYENLLNDTEKIKSIVYNVQNIQYGRCGKLNSYLSNAELKKFCSLNEKDEEFLIAAASKLQFSARTYHKILRVARTIADIDQSDSVEISHLYEAFSYRNLSY